MARPFPGHKIMTIGLYEDICAGVVLSPPPQISRYADIQISRYPDSQSKTHKPEIDDLLVERCLTLFVFALSVHAIGTIFKSHALTFQSPSI